MSPLIAATIVAAVCASDAQQISGDAMIERAAGDAKIVIRTTSRLAGAIDSLTYAGKQFIDSADHGRQLQSACSFHDGHGRFVAEAFNPTEAGSRHDGAGPTSSSQLLKLVANGNQLASEARMAFWLRPGETSDGQTARNTSPLSDVTLARRVTIGERDLPHAIRYDVTFHVPDGGRHTLGQFEAVTGYMPLEFARFYTYDPKQGALAPLDDGPGEQRLPVVFATDDERHAMGVWSPQQPSRGFEHAGYGRFRFTAQKVVKWNCVFRERNSDGIAAGNYRYVCYVAVGSLREVTHTIGTLAERAFDGRSPTKKPTR